MSADFSNPAAPHTGITEVMKPAQWAVSSAPAANAQASASRPAVTTSTPTGTPAPRHVCTSIAGNFAVDTAGTPVRTTLRLRDGATGAGAILWEHGMSFAGMPVGAQASVVVEGIEVFGSPGTAMTLEFSAAGGANTFESCSMTGFTVV